MQHIANVKNDPRARDKYVRGLYLSGACSFARLCFEERKCAMAPPANVGYAPVSKHQGI